MTVKTSPQPPSAPADGFSAQLRGVSLFDLIQLECASRGRKVVRVTSDERTALLYFCDGRIVHAVAGRAAGESAVREVLTWGNGTFARFDHFGGAWPKLETISGSTEGVLLRAAQQLDEERGKVVPLPVREAPRPPPLPPQARPPAPRPPAELTVHISPDGELLDRRGSSEQDGFGDVVAYAAQLTDLLGHLLGLAAFNDVELAFRESRCLMVRQADRTLLAVKTAGHRSLDDLRRRLGLDG